MDMAVIPLFDEDEKDEVRAVATHSMTNYA